MLQWIFGPLYDLSVSVKNKDTNAGKLIFKKAEVDWYLSINAHNLPQSAIDKGHSTFRSLNIEGEEMEFSKGFTDLHTVSYEKILNGEGYGLSDAKSSIEIVSQIRKIKNVQ